MKLQLSVLIVLLLLVPFFLSPNFGGTASAQNGTPDVFVGVDVAYDNITSTKELANTMRPYTNLFIIGCSYGIDFRNTTRLNDLFDLCQYLYDKGYYFIIFENVQPLPQVVERVRNFGSRFLGFYAYDEMGGRQLDQASNNPHFNESENHVVASDFFVNRLNGWLFNNTGFAFTRPFSYPTEFRLFTSDYALYYFDYKAGYNAVFAQLGWNYSRQLNIALCRGAATAQGKDWGTMVCWKYTQAPYMESTTELYSDMVLSYDNGARYIIVFDSDVNYTRSILTAEHLEAMKQFWQYTQENPRSNANAADRVAYLLPTGYGYGFRGPEDKIWGVWNADMTSFMLSISVNIMLQKYGSNVDIIYEDAIQSGDTLGYGDVVYWNNPAAVSDLWPRDWPIPTISPSPGQTQGIDNQEPKNNYLYIAGGGIAFSTISAVVLMLRRRLRKTQAANS